MSKSKAEGLWIRLSHEERAEIEQEASVSGFNMSEIARQRLFNDPIARLERRLEKVEQRSLSQLAWSNLIAELIESILPKDKRISKKLMQARINQLKVLILKVENDMNFQFIVEGDE